MSILKKMNYTEQTEKIIEYTKAHVKQSRFEHSERVAEACKALCRKYGLDAEKGWFVGMCHDMCKDLEISRMIELALKDGEDMEFEKQKPSLLHGRAAAVMLKEDFGIDDEEIIEAVAVHTSGKPGMCDLSKCLFIADKIEPGRPQSTDEYRARFENMELDEMLYTVIKENFDYIKAKGYDIYPSSVIMLETLEKKWGGK